MDLISLVIPSFNRGNIITYTIDSIIKQSYSNWELIIVDDGSTDNTKEVIQTLSSVENRIKYFERPNHKIKGANSCRNFGFEKAKGKYIKWVDSDDILTPQALEKQINIMVAKPDIKACFAYGRFFNDSTKELEEGWARKYTSENLLWDYIRNQVRWPIGGPLWRKDYFRQLPFNELLMNSQEWLMHGQQIIKLKPNEFYILPEDIYLIRRGNERMSSKRTSKYYLNSAKSRLFLLFNHLISNERSPKVTVELVKQILVYSFHATRSSIKSVKG